MGYESSGAHAKREPYAKLAIRNMLRGKSVELLLGDESGKASLAMIELTGLGKIHSSGWDGIFWESSAMQGQRLVKGAKRSMMLRLNDIRAAADWRKYYDGATTEAEETIDGQPCYRVISKPKDGDRSIQSMGPQKMDNKIVEILLNADIEEAKLEPPVDIKALIAKEQKTNE